MSRFLNNLAAKGRGTIPRLEPRRPAPYEGLPDEPVPGHLEPMPQTSGPLDQPPVPEVATPSPPTTPAVAVPSPEPAELIPASPHWPGPADTKLALNRLSPMPASPAPSVTPVAAPRVARLKADATPSAPPPPLAPALLSSTQTQAPHPPAKITPASSDATGRAAPAPPPETVVLPTAETLRPVIDTPQTPPATQTQEWSQPTSSKQPEAAPLPLLQVEVQHPHPAAQAPVQPPVDAAPITEAPLVEVNIGTIEVVADQPPAPIPQPRAAASRCISLDDFLDGTARR